MAWRPSPILPKGLRNLGTSGILCTPLEFSIAHVNMLFIATGFLTQSTVAPKQWTLSLACLARSLLVATLLSVPSSCPHLPTRLSPLSSHPLLAFSTLRRRLPLTTSSTATSPRALSIWAAGCTSPTCPSASGTLTWWFSSASMAPW